MKIISPFTDFYDGVSVHGIDPKLIYNRHTEIRHIQGPPSGWIKPHETHAAAFDRTLFPLWKLLASSPWPRWAPKKGHFRYARPSSDLGRVLVCFCGRAHVTYVRWAHSNNWFKPLGQSPDAVLDFVKGQVKNEEEHAYEYLIDPDFVDFHRNDKEILPFRPHQKTPWTPESSYPFNDKGREKWFTATDFAVSDDIHRTVGAPVFILSSRWPDQRPKRRGSRILVINPCLRDLDFARVVDPYTAHQEISRYLGSTLAAQHDPPQPISDADMAAMKGHGGKYSFRQPPTKPPYQGKKRK